MPGDEAPYNSYEICKPYQRGSLDRGIANADAREKHCPWRLISRKSRTVFLKMMINWEKDVGSKDDRKQASCQVPSSTRRPAAFAYRNEFCKVIK